MTQFFDITTVSTTVAIEDRSGRASFTVTNATDASISGDAVIVPEPDTDKAWFTVDGPSRVYSVEESEQVGVDIDLPEDVPAGTYRFKLRVLLGGGVPEEQFDDSPLVSFTVPDAPPPPPPPEPEPKKPFPWWIVAVIGGIGALVVSAVVVYVLFFMGDDGKLVFKSEPNGGGDTVCTLDVKEGEVRFDGTECADDVASSLILEAVSSGVSVDVFNDAECSESVSWTEIDVKRKDDEATVPTFENDMAAAPVAVTYHPRFRQTPEGVEIISYGTDYESMVSLIRARGDAGISALAFELPRGFTIPDYVRVPAEEIGMTLWELPPEEDRGVNGRVSCVKMRGADRYQPGRIDPASTGQAAMRIGPVEIPRWLLLLVVILVVISSGSCSCGVLGLPEGDTQDNIDHRLKELKPGSERILPTELRGDCPIDIDNDTVTFAGSCEIRIEPTFAFDRKLSLVSSDSVRAMMLYEAAKEPPSENLSGEPVDAIVGFNEGLTVRLDCLSFSCIVVLK